MYIFLKTEQDSMTWLAPAFKLFVLFVYFFYVAVGGFLAVLLSNELDMNVWFRLWPAVGNS